MPPTTSLQLAATTHDAQGNVLTGEGVNLAAEEALVQTEGDLGQKLMAAMQAATPKQEPRLRRWATSQ